MSVSEYQYIDRFFHAAFELTSLHEAGRRDSQSFFTFLEAMHSLADKLNKHFKASLQTCPEFILLRILRNYVHHTGDVKEFLLYSPPNSEYVQLYAQHIIVPASEIAKAIKAFRDHEKRNGKQDRAEANLRQILDICDCGPLIKETPLFIPKAQLKLDGRVYDLGFDLFKPIYNLTNIIADKCRSLPELSSIRSIVELDPSVTTANNIPKHCLLARSGTELVLTTEGQVAAKRIEQV